MSITNDKAIALMRHTDGPIGEDLKALVCQISITHIRAVPSCDIG